MKKLIILIVILLLVGCASQKTLQIHKWHTEYLNAKMLRLDIERDAYADTVITIRKLATDIIAQDNEKIKIMGAVIVDFIEITEKSIADSILEKHDMRYDRTGDEAGTTIESEE